MNYLGWMIVINIIIWTPWLWRYRIRPYYEKKNLNVLLNNHPDKESYKTTLRLLTELFRQTPAEKISRQERKRLDIDADSFTYGEIVFLSFVTILDKVAPQPGEVFYDLGSGSGKAVFTAALNYDLSKSVGVELLPGLCDLANAQIKHAENLVHSRYKNLADRYLKRISSIKFMNDNFLNCDLSDCNILFINATCLDYSAWEKIQNKMVDLKAGSRIILTTKKIQRENFQLLHHGMELMSWGMNSVYIYEKLI